MKVPSGKTVVVLVGLAFLAAPLVFALAEAANDFHEEGEEELELGVISGLITFICVVSTVVVGRLMRKGKAKVTTHHTLAYITVAVALFHGVYNLLTR